MPASPASAFPAGSQRDRPVRLRARRLRGARNPLLALLGLGTALGATAAQALPMSFAGSTTIGGEVDPVWSSAWFSHALDRHNGLGLSLQRLPASTDQDHHASSADGPGSHALQGEEAFALVDWTRLVRRWNLDGAQANLWLFAGVGMYHASGTRQQSIRVSERRVPIAGPAPDNGQNAPPVPAPPEPFPPDHSQHSLQEHLALVNGSQPGGTAGAGPESAPGPSDPQAAPADGSVQPPRERIVREVEIITTPAEPSLRIAASPGLQFDIETTRLRLEARGRMFLAPGIQRSQLSATAGVGLTPARYQGVQPWLELQVRAMPGVIDGVELIPKLRLLQRRMVLEIGYSNLGSLVGGFTFTL